MPVTSLVRPKPTVGSPMPIRPSNAGLALAGLLLSIAAPAMGAPPSKHAAKSVARQAPAPPKPIVWVSCGYDSKEGPHAITPAFTMEDPGGNWTGWEWVKRMEAETDSQRSSMLSCTTRQTREEVEADRQRTIDYYQGIRPIVTLSPPPGAGLSSGPGASARSHAASGAGALIVKTDTSLRDAGKAWDEQVRKTLAVEAQKKVETAAKAAQADAKRQAEIAAFFAERRKQGRAQ